MNRNRIKKAVEDAEWQIMDVNQRDVFLRMNRERSEAFELKKKESMKANSKVPQRISSHLKMPIKSHLRILSRGNSGKMTITDRFSKEMRPSTVTAEESNMFYNVIKSPMSILSPAEMLSDLLEKDKSFKQSIRPKTAGLRGSNNNRILSGDKAVERSELLKNNFFIG